MDVGVENDMVRFRGTKDWCVAGGESATAHDMYGRIRESESKEAGAVRRRDGRQRATLGRHNARGILSLLRHPRDALSQTGRFGHCRKPSQLRALPRRTQQRRTCGTHDAVFRADAVQCSSLLLTGDAGSEAVRAAASEK